MNSYYFYQILCLFPFICNFIDNEDSCLTMTLFSGFTVDIYLWLKHEVIVTAKLVELQKFYLLPKWNIQIQA